jgi:diguanylate cyclase (GGDEF)-like protein
VTGPDREADSLRRARGDVERDQEALSHQDADQTAADLDQTQADVDQAASDADQRNSDADQTLADREQHASDRDQAAADWEGSHSARASSATALARETSRDERAAATKERDSSAAGRSRRTAERLVIATRRDEVARVRDVTATARDRIARARDVAADARDRAAEARERRAVGSGDVAVALLPLKEMRAAAAAVRRESAEERNAAASDRVAAAEDRRQAGLDRRVAGLDELTGVFRRGTGDLALAHEIDRSRRSRRALVLALIDVDGLKTVNDTEGHAAGDTLLRDVAQAITSTLRSYDVVVRWGGDEFICALSDVSLEVSSERIAEIRRALAIARDDASISIGLAELGEEDTLESLTARADIALYEAKTDRDT